MRLIFKTDSRADRSILALLTACQECLNTPQVVQWLLLQMLTYVDCSSEMVKNCCVKIIAMAHNKNLTGLQVFVLANIFFYLFICLCGRASRYSINTLSPVAKL